jgi:hypothetical protein
MPPARSHAEPADAAAPGRPWLLTLQFENDLFAGFDEQYTNGSYLTVGLPVNDLPLWARWTREGLSGIIDAPRWQASYGLGQSMFTPSDITDPDPPLDDRPYAGFLFGSLYLTADTGRRLDTVAFEVGVTGPPSLAEAAQKFIHNDLGLGDPPNGWHTQLETEVAFRVLYEQKRRYGAELGPEWGGLEVDAIPHVAVALGTVDTSLAAALTLRVGEGLDMGLRSFARPPLGRPDADARRRSGDALEPVRGRGRAAGGTRSVPRRKHLPRQPQRGQQAVRGGLQPRRLGRAGPRGAELRPCAALARFRGARGLGPVRLAVAARAVLTGGVRRRRRSP